MQSPALPAINLIIGISEMDSSPDWSLQAPIYQIAIHLGPGPGPEITCSVCSARVSRI